MVNPILKEIGREGLRLGIDFIRRRRAERNIPESTPYTDDELAEIAEIQQQNASADPVSQNARNEEGLGASRTFTGAVGVVITAGGALIDNWNLADGVSLEIMLGATLLSAIVVMIGRAKEGLAGLNWSKPLTIPFQLFGIGRTARGIVKPPN